MAWQPIETSPRDGTWFLVWMPHDRKHDLPRLAQWARWARYDGRGKWLDPRQPEYRESGSGPTPPPKGAMWHPLPAHPVVEEP
jgi:hypothetical protein